MSFSCSALWSDMFVLLSEMLGRLLSVYKVIESRTLSRVGGL